MKMNSSVVSAILAGSLTLGGLGVVGNLIPASSPVKLASTVQNIKKESSQKEINTTVGKTFNITLEENATTGFTWNYVTDNNGITLVKESVKDNKSDEENIGSSSDKTWTFNATKPGTYTITFNYARPWEKDDKNDRTVVYTVKVSDHKEVKPVVLATNKVNSVKAGTPFIVNLEENATTGYTWKFQNTNKNMKLISSTVESQSDAIGAASNKTWTFKATKPGTYKLTFKYVKSGDKAKAETVTYTVKVK